MLRSSHFAFVPFTRKLLTLSPTHGFLIRTRFLMSDLILLRFRIFPVTNGKEKCQIILLKTVFVHLRF